MIIIETPIFTKQVLSILSDDDYRLLQQVLLERPDAGNVIPGSGGLRKLRWAVEGRGKRGGVRVIYYWFKGFWDSIRNYPELSKLSSLFRLLI